MEEEEGIPDVEESDEEFPCKSKCYDILGVSPDDRISDIKKTWQKLAKKWHPDKNPSDKATARMQDILMAWGIIGNEDKRAAYDAKYKDIIMSRHKETGPEPGPEPAPAAPAPAPEPTGSIFIPEKGWILPDKYDDGSNFNFNGPINFHIRSDVFSLEQDQALWVEPPFAIAVEQNRWSVEL